MTFLNETAVRTGDASLVANKSKFLKVAASSGHKNALEQVLGSAEVRSQMADVKAVTEVVLCTLFFMLAYGHWGSGSCSGAILHHSF
jgi:protein pelota